MPDAGEPEEGVDGGFQETGVPLDLGEQEAALEYGEERDGQVVRVGAGWQVPCGVQTAQPVSDRG